MSYSFDNDLFVTENGAAMCFNVERCLNAEELADYIQHAGGKVKKDTTGPHTITFTGSQNVDSELSGNVEVYSSEYITKCCTKNKLFDLNKFRCSSSSIYKDEFNAMDVLQQKLSWEDAQKLLITNHKEPDTKRLSLPGNSLSASSVSNGSSRSNKVVLTQALGPRTTTKYRCEFTTKERKEMVQFLQDKKGYDELRGTAIWKRMSVKFPNHTWMSLKEHFNKKIMPFIGTSTYGLPDNEVQRFRKGMRMSIKRKPVPSNQYTEDDDEVILEYVSAKGKNAKLGGNTFWQEMQEKNTLPGRSWHSVRERYLKYLRNTPFSPSSSIRKKSPGKRKTSPIIETSSDSDGDKSQTDEMMKDEEKKISAQRESEKVKNQVKEMGHEATACKKRKKLFTLPDNFDSPNSHIPDFSPVSEKRTGPSMLDILRRRHQREAEAKQRNFRVLKKKRALSQEMYEHHSEDEQQDENKPRGGEKQSRGDEHPSEDEQRDENKPREKQSHGNEHQSEDELLDDEEQSGKEQLDDEHQCQGQGLINDDHQSEDELLDDEEKRGKERVDDKQEGLCQGEQVEIHDDLLNYNEKHTRDEEQHDNQSDTTIETDLPSSLSMHVNNPSNEINSYDDEQGESDDSDWSIDGLHSRGPYVKKPRRNNETSKQSEEQRQSVSVPVASKPNPTVETPNPEEIVKKTTLAPSDALQQDCSEEPFDFLGDMTHFDEVPVHSGVTLIGTEKSQFSNLAENSQIIDDSQAAVNEKAESERPIAILSTMLSTENNTSFEPLCHSTQKNKLLTKSVSVQVKEKVNVATQTDPVLIFPLDGGSVNNSPQLSPKRPQMKLRKRPSSSKAENTDESFDSPSPATAAMKILCTPPRKRITRSAVRESDSEEGLSPKFTPTK